VSIAIGGKVSFCRGRMFRYICRPPAKR